MNEEQWRWSGGDGDGDNNMASKFASKGGFVAYPNDHRTSQQRRHQQFVSSSWPVILYIPNLLGYLRIMLAFRGLHYALHSRQSKALNMWIGAALLDMLDGIAARWMNQCSEFGILLDIVADNILRTIIWSSCIMEISNNNAASNDGSSFDCVFAAVVIICLEWITMFCSQSSAAARTKQQTKDEYSHWKDAKRRITNIDKKKVLSPPFWVQAVFANNFRTIPGIFAIYGLFVAPFSTYVWYADSMTKETWPTQLFSEQVLLFLIYMSYAGRFLSAMVELWLCYEYLNGVIERDSKQKSNQ
jgi:phosphatidylglycerophosphate synthase